MRHGNESRFCKKITHPALLPLPLIPHQLRTVHQYSTLCWGISRMHQLGSGLSIWGFVSNTPICLG
jgi:hypothetical protein